MSLTPEFETPPSDEVRRATEFADRMVASATAALGNRPWAVGVYNNARFAALETPSLLPAEGSLTPSLGWSGMTEYGSPVTITDFGEDATSPLLLSMGIPHNVVCADGTVLPEGNIRVGRDGNITREVFNKDTLKLETHIVTPEGIKHITGRLNPSTLRPRYEHGYDGQRALFGEYIDDSVAAAIARLRGLSPTWFVDPNAQEGVDYIPVEVAAEPDERPIEDHTVPSDKTLEQLLAKLSSRTQQRAQSNFGLFKDGLLKRTMFGPDSDIIPYPLDPDHLPLNDEPNDQSGPSNATKQD